MKLIELQNVTDSRVVITSVRLTFESGEIKKVHPSMAKHPAVSGLIGKELRNVNTGTAPTAEPKAPVPTTPAKVDPAPQVVHEPIAVQPVETIVAGDDSIPESIDQSFGNALPEEPASAPEEIEDSPVAALEESVPSSAEPQSFKASGKKKNRKN